MKITLFGATGRVGGEILKQALTDGHEVTALVRDPNKLTIDHPLLHIIVGNALNDKSVKSAVNGSHAVISTLGTDGTATISQSIPLVIKAMRAQQIDRIITIGTAGILQARSNPEIYRFQSSESRRKSTHAAEDHLGAYLNLKESQLNWTIICPTYLPNGERKGNYRVRRNFLPENSTKISVYDTADFAYLQLFTDDYINTRVGISY
jgi:putative NADH-flavin reductase